MPGLRRCLEIPFSLGGRVILRIVPPSAETSCLTKPTGRANPVCSSTTGFPFAPGAGYRCKPPLTFSKVQPGVDLLHELSK